MSALRLQALSEPGPVPEIASPRLVLRPHKAGDSEAIAASLSDQRVARMLARVPAPYHRLDAVDWLNRQTASPRPPGWAHAVTTGDDVHIGCVIVSPRQGAWHVGYWLNRFYWGRGLMSEAVHAVAERFFMRMPDVPLHSGVFADNAASLKLQTRLGFRITGLGEVFALARNETVAELHTALNARDLRRP